MNILLVITDTKRKGRVFVTSTLETLSLTEMIAVVNDGFFEKVYAITGTSGTYIRSAPDKTKRNNINTLSVTGTQLVVIAQGRSQSTAAVRAYIESYLKSVSKKAPFIEPVGSFRIPSRVVKKVFQSHASIIRQVARKFNIDDYTLSAIIIDEIARLYPFEPIFEKVSSGIVGRGSTVGVAQVSLETANDIIKKRLYNPNPEDKKLPFAGNLKNNDRKYLYRYAVDPEHNIRFAAAYIRDIVDVWRKTANIDISGRPEIIGTLYSKGYGEPKKNPIPSKRGWQIAKEFYRYAKRWLAGI